MSRISDCFAHLRSRNRKALVGYLCAGDPDMAQSEKDMRTALENGVDILEIGVPFSDPTADGPVIQAAGQRALAAGATLDAILGMTERLRRDYDHPMIMFGYANPFFVRGYAATARDARRAGIDGFLVVDLPHEEAGEFRPFLLESDVDMIPLIAPTTTTERAAAILRDARGFVYVISVTGVTGARAGLPEGFQDQIAALRDITTLPVVVGFGVGNGAQARHAAAAADGVVVGSALVRAAREQRLAAFAGELRAALDRA